MSWFKNKTIDTALTVLEDLICASGYDYAVVVIPPHKTYEEVYMSLCGKPLPPRCIELEGFVKRNMGEIRNELSVPLAVTLGKNEQQRIQFKNKEINLAVVELEFEIFASGDNYSVIIIPPENSHEEVYMSEGGKPLAPRCMKPEEFITRKNKEMMSEMLEPLRKAIEDGEKFHLSGDERLV